MSATGKQFRENRRVSMAVVKKQLSAARLMLQKGKVEEAQTTINQQKPTMNKYGWSARITPSQRHVHTSGI